MEDERQVELDCIAAIFPEILLDPDNPFSASIELPIHPNQPVKVVFPASANGAATLPTPPPSDNSGEERQEEAPAEPTINVESHNLSYLPSLHLHITLPDGYPAERAPKFELSTCPEWLSREELDELQGSGVQLWEEGGRTEVIYGYIDSLQQAAENAFGYGEGKTLEIPQDYKIALLDFDIKAVRAAFEKENFDCGVCLDPKKGSVCHKMIDCGHVFCVQCLQDFYNNAISEGDLVSVRCLAPDCAKKRAEAQSSKKRKARTQLSPSELLQIPLEHEMVTRYVKLKHKADLESDKNTIYCPRKWCQGAARSKKHRKPDGFEVVESDNESEAEDGKNEKFHAGRDLLSVCEDCSFAFCSRCFSSWHGEFTFCAPKKSDGELAEEDKASLEYLKLHTTPCPTCAAPAQKTHGCNHMICFKCNSHFCYLCSAWLEPDNPYGHYNDKKIGCYMRLWELEGGDGDDVGQGYAGDIRGDDGDDEEEEEDEEERPRPGGIRGPQGAMVERVLLQGLPLANLDLAGHEALLAQGAPPVQEAAPVEEIQREGPLVLRINQAAPPPAPAAPAVPNPPQPARGNRRRRGAPNQRVIDPRPAGIRQAAPLGGRRVRPGQQPGDRGAGRAEVAAQRQEAQDAAHQAWVQMFVQMALNDEEDQLDWDSDDEEDAAAWDIPVR